MRLDRKLGQSLFVLLLVALLPASPARGERPISAFMDLATLRFLVRKCTNAIREVNQIFANDPSRALFFGGGGLRGTLAYIYQQSARGFRRDQLCNEFIGSITDFIQEGADKDLFLREGYKLVGSKQGWDVLLSSFWKESRKAGGAAIEKVLVRPDEIDDPFDALAAYHRGESPFINVPESVFAAYRSSQNADGLRDNRKTALILRWLRFNEDLPGLKVTSQQLREAAEIVYTEIASNQLTHNNYWVEKSLKKHFSTMLTRYFDGTNSSDRFWTRYLDSLFQVGIGCHFAKLGYSIRYRNRDYRFRDTFTLDRCIEHALRVQLRGARQYILRSELPKEYRSLSLPAGARIDSALANEWLDVTSTELRNRVAGSLNAPIEASYAFQRETLTAYLYATDSAAKAKFAAAFAAWVDSPLAEDARYWSMFSFAAFQRAGLDSAEMVRRAVAVGVFEGEAKLIEQFAETDPAAVARNAYEDTLNGGRRYLGFRRLADGSVGQAADRGLNQRFRDLLTDNAPEGISAAWIAWVQDATRAGAIISEENLKLLAAQSESNERALDLARRLFSDRLVLTEFYRKLSPKRQLSIAYEEVGRTQFLARLTPGKVALLGDKPPFSLEFMAYLADGTGTDSELYSRVRGAAYADLLAAMTDAPFGALEAWELLRFGARLHPLDWRETDLLTLYLQKYVAPTDLAILATLASDPHIRKYPRIREFVRDSLASAGPVSGTTRARGTGKNLRKLHADIATLLLEHGLEKDFEPLLSGVGTPEQKLTIWVSEPTRELTMARRCSTLLLRLR